MNTDDSSHRWADDVRTVIVVPCFNEASRLPVPRFLEFAARVPGVGFLFVDDGSRDGTAAILGQLMDRAPQRMRMMSLSENVGKAEAVRQGLREAFGGGATHAGYWDADLATPLDEIPSFMMEFQRRPTAIAVIGSRVQMLGRSIERGTLRHYLGRVFATVASMVLSMRVYDTQCGAKIFRATPDVTAALDDPFRSRWIFDVEILARLAARIGAEPASQVVIEFPLEAWKDVSGSKLTARSMIRAFFDLLSIRHRYRV
ncbi:MAG: glycosyltransferase [Gemmatimonadota bacterium]